MADNDENNAGSVKEAKKHLLVRILDGICLATFLLLIVALIVLRAPWKVVAVLIAILLVNTIIPKPVRKWIWLTVATIVMAFIIWVFLPDKNEGWRLYTFDKELAAMEAKRSIPPEENAATIYNQLLESHDPNVFSKDFLFAKRKSLILSEFWESKDYPEVASWLEDNQQIIDQLILACQKDKCRFPIAGDISNPDSKPPADFEEVTKFWWSLQDKRILPMKRWGEVLIISANNDIADSRVDEGLRKYIATLQMAKHLYQQPIPLDLLVGIAINLLGLDQINEYIVTGDANDEHLQLLKNTLQSFEYDWQSDLHQILDREKLMFKSFMCAMFYQITPEGEVRFNRDPRSTLRAQFRYILVSGESTWEPFKPDSYSQIKCTKAMSVLCWFCVPSTPQKAALVIDDIYQRYYSMSDPEYDWQEKWGRFTLKSIRLNFRCLLEMMSRILESNWPVIHDRYLRAVTEKKGSQLLIALRDYKNKIGRWPEKLEELKSFYPEELFIDPVNDESFIYRLNEENFMLYSKGRNKIDENCEHNGLTVLQPCCSLRLSIEFVKDRADDILIWPTEKQHSKSIKETPGNKP